MRDFLLASVVIMAVLFGWVAVQQAARRFAERHPEFGPYRERGGCGGHCGCGGGDCMVGKRPTDRAAPAREAARSA